MNHKRIIVNEDIYSDILNIKKMLIDKCNLDRNLSIRETMEIIWNLKGENNIGLEEAIRKIRKENIKIAWGEHGRGSRKYRKGQLKIDLIRA